MTLLEKLGINKENMHAAKTAYKVLVSAIATFNKSLIVTKAKRRISLSNNN